MFSYSGCRRSLKKHLAPAVMRRTSHSIIMLILAISIFIAHYLKATSLNYIKNALFTFVANRPTYLSAIWLRETNCGNCNLKLQNIYLEVFQLRLKRPSWVARQNGLGLSLSSLASIPLPTAFVMAMILVLLVRVFGNYFKEHAMSS